MRKRCSSSNVALGDYQYSTEYFFLIANISIILARFTQPDRRISKFGLRHSHDEVQILIFDDPAEEK